MPWSNEDGKRELMARAVELADKGAPILDVGPGAGTYGDRLRAKGFTSVDALEVFEPYVSRFKLLDKYRSVLIGDVRTFRTSEKYELVILGDVLEHLSARDAQAFMLRLPLVTKAALFSVPWQFKQGVSDGNEAEAHLQDDLTPSIMKKRFPALRLIYCGPIIGVYEWVAPIWPSITVCTLTHARYRLLTHCCASVAMLSYPGEFNHVVINDCPEQKLTIPGVDVVNIKSRIMSVGEKRNIAVAEANSDWIVWVDDDDSLLPHHLLKIQYAIREGASVLLSEQAIWFCGDKGEVKGGICADIFMRRSAIIRAGCFPALSVGEDRALVDALAAGEKTLSDPSREPSYVEAWCNGAYHVSGQGFSPSAQQRFREDAVRRIASGEEPQGLLNLVPTMLFNYEVLAAPIISAWKDSHGF